MAQTKITGRQADISALQLNDIPDSYTGQSGKALVVNVGETALEFGSVAAGVPTSITVANEGTDTTCFPLFTTAATGDLGPKTNAGLAFNSSKGLLQVNTLEVSPATDHSVSGTVVSLTANEAQNFGDVCFINSTGKAQLGDADSISTASCVAMCTETVSASGTANYLIRGIARDDTWGWTIGGIIYLSVTGTTGNTLTQTIPSGSGDIVQILGIALSADTILFTPQLAQVEIA